MTTQLSDTLQDLVSLPPTQLGTILDNLTNREAEQILYDWSIWARSTQIPPSTWGKEHSTWILKAGRGYGKTRVICEIVRAEVESERSGRIGIIAETAADARDVIVEGSSGILACSPPWNYPNYEPSKRRLTWNNGARATLYSADDPEQVRGPEHDFLACDELGKWRYGIETWTNAMLGLRLGNSLCIGATTPRRTPLFLDLMKDPNVVVTGGTTYENMSNLSKTFIQQIIRRYEGTSKGKQELMGILLEDVPGALWTYKIIDNNRIMPIDVPDLVKIVVGIDPAATSNKDSDETGIVVAGKDENGHGYVLEDATVQLPPAGWARQAILQYQEFDADHLTPEVNNGGEMVTHTIRSVEGGKDISIKPVHASRGKITRAEPISALYQQGLIHHVGSFAELEEQMTSYVQGDTKSPDRLDALVWALTDLFPNVEPRKKMRSIG